MVRRLISSIRLSSRIFHKLALLYCTVSFVYTTKLASPLFTIIFATFLLGESTPSRLLFPLVPLLGGILFCSSPEMNTSPFGLACAFASIILISLSTVLTKKTLAGHSSENLPFLLFSDLTSLTVLLPFWLVLDILGANPPAPPATEAAAQGGIALSSELVILLLLNGIGQVGQGIFGLWVMQEVSAMTFAVVGVMKRVFVVLGAVVWFGEAVGWEKGLGLTLGFVGVSWYVIEKVQMKREKERRDLWKIQIV
uniref:Sugar phosphate transporter domain-containing protein n=1 Tax=Arcella intermedia TaxID=1963864 RepID=A0A6B2LF73_9EUKA